MPHANFACVLGLKQHVLQDMASVAYAEGQLPHLFQMDEEVAGMFKFAADLFSECPQFLFASAEASRIRISIRAWGPMQIGLPTYANGAIGLQIEEREVLFETLLLASHRLAVEDGELAFGVDSDSLTILSKSITVLSGGPFSAGGRALLESSIFDNLLATALRERFHDMSDSLPAMDISFLEPLLGIPLTPDEDDPPLTLYAYGRSFNEALTIGIDFEQAGYATAGTASLLRDDTGAYDLTVWANPIVWLDNMTTKLVDGSDDQSGIREQVEAAGAELTSFELDLREGYLRGEGSAAQARYGSVDFSYEVRSHLVRPRVFENLGQDELGYPIIIDHPATEELWFQVTNIDVDVDAAWWITLAEVIAGLSTFGIAALAIDCFIDMVRWNVAAQVRQGGTAGRSREYTFRSTPGGPPIHGKLNAFEFHDNGIFIGLALSVQFQRPGIFSSNYPYPQEWTFNVVDLEELRRSPLRYGVRLPASVLLDDPNLRIRWTARSDAGQMLASNDGLAALNDSIVVAAVGNIAKIRVECRVYRTLGPDITEVYNGAFTTWLRDRLDKTKPYVRWSHHVYTPDVRVEVDSSQTMVGEHIKYRKSKIHRTDFPGRCRMASRFSLSKPGRFRIPSNRPTRIEYLGELPFPRDQLRHHRAELCDYCFFGGPSNLEPLPLP